MAAQQPELTEARTAITKEIQELKDLKRDIEHRINLLERLLSEAQPSSKSPESFEEKETVTIPLEVSIKAKNKPVCSWKAGSDNSLSSEMIHRYSRHLLLPSFGVKGQSNLLNSSVLLVGAGGLGSPVALYLAACGIGCLGIIDHDIVEMNNLHRQVIHTEGNIGQSKVKSAAEACRAINSTLKIEEYIDALTTANALDIVSKYDIVVDATDNVSTRYLINDCCVILGKPLVSGAALGLEGQLTVYHQNQGPCYRCLFPTPPPMDACQRCSDNGVLGVVPGIIGCLQALEVIKIASGVGDPLSGRMLIFDALPTRIHVPYAMNDLTKMQQKVIEELAVFGLLRCQKKEKYFIPTKLVSILAARFSESWSQKPTKGFIIVETNFKLYAYSTSNLHYHVLHLFTRIEYQLHNLVVGALTRENMYAAFDHGITADQVIQFLSQNAHPRIAQREPQVPENVMEQLKLWEKDRNRVDITPACIYIDFPSDGTFEKSLKHSKEIEAFLWKHHARKQLVVNREKDDDMRNFMGDLLY